MTLLKLAKKVAVTAAVGVGLAAVSAGNAAAGTFGGAASAPIKIAGLLSPYPELDFGTLPEVQEVFYAPNTELLDESSIEKINQALSSYSTSQPYGCSNPQGCRSRIFEFFLPPFGQLNRTLLKFVQMDRSPSVVPEFRPQSMLIQPYLSGNLQRPATAIPEPSTLLGFITLGGLMLGGAVRKARK